MSDPDFFKAAASAAQAVVAALDSRPLEAARHAVDTALELLPREEVAQLLTSQAIARANAAADLAEALKFKDEP